MARTPFYGRGPGPAIARMDMNTATAPGRAYGQMYANLGSQIGGMIKEYGLNKEKQSKITDKIENRLKLDPSIAQRLTMTGDEDYDKNNVTDMEKLAKGELGLKGLQRLDSAMATINEVDLQKRAEEDREINKKLLVQKFQTNETANKIAAENKDMKDQATTGLLKRADEIKAKIDSGEIQYNDLFPTSKRLINDYDLIKNQQANPFEYAYSTDAESQAKLDELEAKKTSLEIKGKELEITEKTKEAAKMPEFTDKASALASVEDLPEGVSASFKKFKDGFDVELQYKAREFTDIPSIDGFPNYKVIGGFVYEGDPKTKKLTKVQPVSFGEKTELITKAITTLNDNTIKQYSVAKLRGKPNSDGDYEVEDPSTGETIIIPFNQAVEDKITYLDELRQKLQSQVDLDLTTQ